MGYRGAILILVCLACAAQAQIGAKTQQSKITGIWQNNQSGTQMTLMLNQDGSGEFDGESIRYSAQGNVLSISLSGNTTKYTFSLQANTLTLSGGDLDGQIQFTRNGVPVAETTGTNPPGDPPNPTGRNTAIELIGLWSGNGEMIEFKSDGKCVYLGNLFPYQVSQGNVILKSAQGNATFAYSVKGTQLTLSANGQNVIYNRVEGAGAGQHTGRTGNVAQELVGTWCYLNMNTNSQTSRCITLNGDGSYVYHAESSRSVNTETISGGTASQGDDRGTWYVQGDRIYYNSPTSGQGSYRLEKRNHPKNVNDPMIVLDGEPYVTATLRNPWR
ncbi:MAG TPA: hypothetical protein PLR06_00635 [Cyclobacteriaceae bacterium]|nr:hypothetical protein [Cyclobacteriaceae bacterium]